MKDLEKHHAALIDTYLDALVNDIDASPPSGIDATTADLLRDLVRSQHTTHDNAIMQRVWLRALFDAQTKQHVHPSLNSHAIDTIQEETPMQTITYPGFSPAQSPRKSSHARLPLTLAIAAAFTLMFAGVLFMLNDGNSANNSAGLAQQADEETVDIEALLGRYIDELLVAGDTSDVESILSPEHRLVANFQLDQNASTEDTLNALVSLSGLIDSITVEDILSDADSVWARVDIEQNVIMDSETSVTQMANTLRSTGIIVAYLDDGSGVFTSSYVMFNMLIPADLTAVGQEIRAIGQQNETIEAVIESNALLVRTALDNFWGEDAAVLDVDWEYLAESYAPNYRLNVNDGERTEFSANDGVPMARLLELIRTDITFNYPNLSVDIHHMQASGRFVTVEAIITIASPNGENTSNASFVFRIENGLIAEEWWTLETSLFD